MKLNPEPSFRIAFLFGLWGTPALVDPYIPVLLRVAMLAILLVGTSFGASQILFRFVGAKLFKEKSRWSQVADGIGGGTAIAVFILTIANFYFGVHITVPSL
jgi:hypothetical protein